MVGLCKREACCFCQLRVGFLVRFQTSVSTNHLTVILMPITQQSCCPPDIQGIHTAQSQISLCFSAGILAKCFVQNCFVLQDLLLSLQRTRCNLSGFYSHYTSHLPNQQCILNNTGIRYHFDIRLMYSYLKQNAQIPTCATK